MTQIHIKHDAALLDKSIADFEKGLARHLPWLDNVFGKSERVTKQTPEGKVLRLPTYYYSIDDYEELTPSDSLGNYAYFEIEDGQDVTMDHGGAALITADFSLVVWLDFRKLQGTDSRDKESIKREILTALNSIVSDNGSISVTNVYERAENVFSGYDIDEVDNQCLMHPYGGFRFEGRIMSRDLCWRF